MSEIPRGADGAAEIAAAFVTSTEPAPDMRSVKQAMDDLTCQKDGDDAFARAASLHHGEPESQFRV